MLLVSTQPYCILLQASPTHCLGTYVGASQSSCLLLRVHTRPSDGPVPPSVPQRGCAATPLRGRRLLSMSKTLRYGCAAACGVENQYSPRGSKHYLRAYKPLCVWRPWLNLVWRVVPSLCRLPIERQRWVQICAAKRPCRRCPWLNLMWRVLRHVR